MSLELRAERAELLDEDAWARACTRLVDYLQLPSVPWDETVVTQSTTALQQTHYFQTVQCEGSEASLQCVLTPQPIVVRADVTGSLPLALLRDDVRRRVFLRQGTLVPNVDEAVQRQQSRVEAYLRDEGYFDSHAQVHLTPVPVGTPNQGVEVNVEVSVGEPAIVRLVQVEADNLANDPNLRNDLAEVFRHYAFMWFGHARFRPSQLEDDAAKAVSLLQGRGWPAAQVQASFVRDAAAQAVDVKVVVRSGPKLDLTFVGNTAQSSHALEKLTTFKRNNALDAVEVEDTRTAVLQAYQETGYDSAEVLAEVQRTDGGETYRVVYTVNEGLRRKIVRVGLTGNNAFSSRTLADLLLITPSGIFSHRFVNAWATHDEQAITQFYRTQGYPEAITQSERKPLGDDGLEVLFNVQEGPYVQVATVQMDGYPPLGAADTLAKRLHLQPGKPFDRSQLDSDVDQIQAALAAHGYMGGTVAAPDLRVDEAGAHIVHHVHAGEQSKRGGVLVRGALRTAPSIIEDELFLKRGAVLDVVALGAARRRLRALNIFADVQLQPLTVLPHDPNIWLMVGVQEREVRSLDAVLAFSTDDAFTVGADFRDRNLFGRAMALDVELRLSNASQVLIPVRIGNVDRLNVKLHVPRPLTLPFDVEALAAYYYQDTDLFRYRRAGGTAALMRTLVQRSDCDWCPTVVGKFAYELTEANYVEKVAITYTPRGAPTYVPSDTIARLIPSLQFDRRDAPLDPHEGYALELRAELGLPQFAGPLSANARGFWRFIANVQGFYKLATPRPYRFDSENTLGGPLILAGSLQYGAAGPIGQHPGVPLSETYAYGGDFSVRGLETRASSAALVAPYMLVGSGELRWYVYDFGIGTVQLAAFVDVGTVAAYPSKLLQETTISVGPVLRYVTPVGPLSLAYGRAVLLAASLRPFTDVAPPHGRLHFTFGYSF